MKFTDNLVLAKCNAVLQALKTPQSDRDAYIETLMSQKYYRLLRKRLEHSGLVSIHHSEIDRRMGRNINYYVAETDFITNLPEKMESKPNKDFKGAMQRIEGLGEKLKQQQRLIHTDRQNRYHRQGAISAGGVEFV